MLYSFEEPNESESNIGKFARASVSPEDERNLIDLYADYRRHGNRGIGFTAGRQVRRCRLISGHKAICAAYLGRRPRQ
jgi:hypothetical protein